MTTSDDRVSAVHGDGQTTHPRPLAAARKITQIYEGTNQIQRMVMARSLLK